MKGRGTAVAAGGALVLVLTYGLVLRPMLLEPRAGFAAPTQNVGRVRAGQGVEVSFPIRNAGLAPLRILSVEPGCGCLKPEYPQHVPGGATRQITALFQPDVFWSGPIDKSIVVRTNDPRHREVRLKIAGEIVPYVEQDPPGPVTVRYGPGQVVHETVRLIPPDEKMEIPGPGGAADVKARVFPPAAGDPRHAYRVELEIGPFHGVGDPIRTVHLRTTDPRYPDVGIVVTGRAQSGPVMFPPELVAPAFGAGELGKVLGTVQLFTRSGRLHVLGVDVQGRPLRADIAEKGPGQSYEVTLRYSGGWRPGPVSCAVRILTDDPQFPIVPLVIKTEVR